MPSVPWLELITHMLRGRPTFQDPELSPNIFQVVLSICRCVLALVCYVCNALAALHNHGHIQAKAFAPPPVVLRTFCEVHHSPVVMIF